MAFVFYVEQFLNDIIEGKFNRLGWEQHRVVYLSAFLCFFVLFWCCVFKKKANSDLLFARLGLDQQKFHKLKKELKKIMYAC